LRRFGFRGRHFARALIESVNQKNGHARGAAGMLGSSKGHGPCWRAIHGLGSGVEFAVGDPLSRTATLRWRLDYAVLRRVVTQKKYTRPKAIRTGAMEAKAAIFSGAKAQMTV
jgi:hypothetical protein